MATITATDASGPGSSTVTEVTLTGSSDTFTFNPQNDPILIMRNDTAGALTPTFDGDGGSTVGLPGVGNVDVSSGYTFSSIGAGAVVTVRLNTIRKYLQGTIAITGGTGLVCSLLEY